MQTLRGRLTAWYSVALALTLAAFAAVLYTARRTASYRAPSSPPRRDAPPRARRAPRPLCDPVRHGGGPPVWGDPHRGEHPLSRPRCRAAARHVRPGAAARARRRRADRVVDLAPRARRRGSDHHRSARDQRWPEPAPATGGAAREGRARPTGRDAEPNDDAARAELRRPAPLPRRREPRAQDATHGAARRSRARHYDPAPAPSDAP